MCMTRKLWRAAPLAGHNVWLMSDGFNATNTDNWKKWDRYDH